MRVIRGVRVKRATNHILLVYPQFEASYWGMQFALPLILKKSLMPPLGLITIAAMIPDGYEVRLADLNTGPLRDEDLEWAGTVLLSAMLVQKEALRVVAARCREAGALVVFGGPYPTACPDECMPHCDVLVLDEGELTFPLFLSDLAAGTVKRVYRSPEKADITLSPTPRFDLLRVRDYVSMPVQFSRGCPYDCEFCDITVLFGRRPRTKAPPQLLRELDALYATGYRGQVFVVDDNFIGNKRKVMELLPHLERWNHEHEHPFTYGTEASLNLADDPALLAGMAAAGFIFAFLGLETPSVEGLRETNKLQNIAGSMLDRVANIQRAGLQVYAGFIVGFDSDGEDIFERQVEFISAAAIANAMVGPLMALPGTRLHGRMQREGRLVDSTDYENWYESGDTNIITAMPAPMLLKGLRGILTRIYEPAGYFDRALRGFQLSPRRRTWRERWKQFRRSAASYAGGKPEPGEVRPGFVDTVRFFVSLYRGLPQEFRKPMVRFLREMVRTCPEQLPQALPFLCMAYHCYCYTAQYAVPRIDRAHARLTGLSHPGLAALARELLVGSHARPATSFQIVGDQRNPSAIIRSIP
jgi:radical SAM superfamily enzyme YgiQ (UPF0313 family)